METAHPASTFKSTAVAPELGACPVCGGFVWKHRRDGYHVGEHLAAFEKVVPGLPNQQWRHVYACVACLAASAIESRPRIRAGAAPQPPTAAAEPETLGALRRPSIEEDAEAVASALVERGRRPDLWSVYRQRAFEALLERATRFSHCNETPAQGASGAGDFSALVAAVNDRAREIYDGDGLPKDLADAKDLIRALARLLNKESLRSAFGAPGDWGYNSAIGKALARAYAPPIDPELQINLSPAQVVAAGEETGQSSYWRGLDKPEDERDYQDRVSKEYAKAVQADDTCEDGGVE